MMVYIEILIILCGIIYVNYLRACVHVFDVRRYFQHVTPAAQYILASIKLSPNQKSIYPSTNTPIHSNGANCLLRLSGHDV